MNLSSLKSAINRLERWPSDKQKEVGNYTKGHIKIHGLDISIENAKGSVRTGKDKTGKKWSSILPDHYGYIKRTTGADGDHVDCYLGPHHNARRVFVIDQKHHDTGKFDEHKVMIGYDDQQSALRAYRAAFSDSHDRVLACTAMTIPRFRKWLNSNTVLPVNYFAG